MLCAQFQKYKTCPGKEEHILVSRMTGFQYAVKDEVDATSPAHGSETVDLQDVQSVQHLHQNVHTKFNLANGQCENKKLAADDDLQRFSRNLLEYFWDDHLEKLVHPRKGTKLGVQEALGVSLIPKNIRVQQFHKDEHVALTDALASGQVDRKYGRVVSMKDGSVLSLKEAIKRDVIFVESSSSLDAHSAAQSLSAVKKELGCGLFELIVARKASMTVRIMDRRTGKKFKLPDAIAHSIFNADTAHVKDTVSGKWFSWEDGQRAGVIHDSRKLSLHQTLTSPIFNQNLEGFLDPSGLVSNLLTLEEMLQRNLVDVSKKEVFDTEIGKWLTMEEAISVGVIDPIQNKYFHKKIGKILPLPDALEAGLICEDPVEETSTSDKSEHHVNGISRSHSGSSISEVDLDATTVFPLPVYKAVCDGLINSLTGDVIISDKKTIPFKLAYEEKLLKAEDTYIVDRCTGVVYTFKEAANCGLVEVPTGSVFDTYTGKKLLLPEARGQGLLRDTPQPHLPLAVAAELELFDFDEQRILHPHSRQPLSLTQAMTEGIIDPASKLTTPSGDLTTLQEVIKEGLLNLDTLTLSFPDGRSMSLKKSVGLEEGKQPNTYEFGRKKSLTLDEAISSGLYDPVSNSVRSSDSLISFSKALKSGLINTDSLVRDPYSGDILSLKEALDKRIIDSECGKMIDTHGIPVALNFAMEKGLILKSKAPLNLSLSEALDEGLFNVLSNRFLNPDSNEEVDFITAVDQGILDTEFIRVRDTRSGSIVTFDAAVDQGLIDIHQGFCINAEDGEEFSIVDGMDKGIIIDTTSQPAVTLEEALEEGILEVETCTFKDPYGQISLTLKDALESGLLNRFSVSVRDINTKSLLSLDGAINQGLIDPVTGMYRKSEDDEVMFKEALEKGLVFSDVCILDKSLMDSVKQGLYNPRTCKFTDPSTGRVRTLKEMVRDEKVDPQLVLVLDKSEKRLLSFEEAIEAKVLDVKRGLVVDTETGELLNLKEAMGCGLLQENISSISVSLKQAVDTGLLHKSQGRIVDPLSRKQLVVEDAISVGLIDVSCLLVKNQDKERYQFLEESAHDGIVFVDDDSIVYARSGVAVDVVTAFEKNLLIEIPQNGFLLGDILSSGLYDEQNKRFKDPLTGKSLTLTEAISSGVINANHPQVVVPSLGKFSLQQAIQKGIIDPNTGDYIALDKPLTLSDAILSGRVSALSRSTSNLTASSTKHCHSIDKGTLKASLSEPIFDLRKREPSKTAASFLSSNDKFAKQGETSGTLDSMVSHKYSVDEDGDGHDKAADYAQTAKVKNLIKMQMKRMSESFNEQLQEDRQDGPTSMQSSVLSLTSMSSSFTSSSLSVANQQSREETYYQGDSTPALTESIVITPNQPLHLHMKSHSAGNLLDAAALSKRLSREMEAASPSLGNIHQIMRPQEASHLDMADLPGSHWAPPANELSASLDSLILDAIRKQQIEQKPMPLYDVIRNGLFDDDTKMFCDPETDKMMDLLEAVSTGLIDPSHKEVINPVTKQPVTLADAMQTGVIDAALCKFVDESTGAHLSLQQAIDVGLIFKEKEIRKAPVDIFVEEILPDSTSSGRKKLEEAFSNGILHRSNSQVIDPDSINGITLRRAASLGLIDVKTGDFKNPQTGECMSLAVAVEKGFILSPKGLTLYGAVNQGLYIDATGLFQHPTTGETKTLQDLINDDIVSSLCPEVKDLAQDSIVSLAEGIKRGIINVEKGLYICKNKAKTYSFREAVAAGLIVSTSAREGLPEIQQRPKLSLSSVPFCAMSFDESKVIKKEPGDSIHSVPFRKSLSDPGQGVIQRDRRHEHPASSSANHEESENGSIWKASEKQNASKDVCPESLLSSCSDKDNTGYTEGIKALQTTQKILPKLKTESAVSPQISLLTFDQENEDQSMMRICHLQKRLTVESDGLSGNLTPSFDVAPEVITLPVVAESEIVDKLVKHRREATDTSLAAAYTHPEDHHRPDTNFSAVDVLHGAQHTGKDAVEEQLKATSARGAAREKLDNADQNNTQDTKAKHKLYVLSEVQNSVPTTCPSQSRESLQIANNTTSGQDLSVTKPYTTKTERLSPSADLPVLTNTYGRHVDELGLDESLTDASQLQSQSEVWPLSRDMQGADRSGEVWVVGKSLKAKQEMQMHSAVSSALMDTRGTITSYEDVLLSDPRKVEQAQDLQIINRSDKTLPLSKSWVDNSPQRQDKVVIPSVLVSADNPPMVLGSVAPEFHGSQSQRQGTVSLQLALLQQSKDDLHSVCGVNEELSNSKVPEVEESKGFTPEGTSGSISWVRDIGVGKHMEVRHPDTGLEPSEEETGKFHMWDQRTRAHNNLQDIFLPGEYCEMQVFSGRQSEIPELQPGSKLSPETRVSSSVKEELTERSKQEASDKLLHTKSSCRTKPTHRVRFKEPYPEADEIDSIASTDTTDTTETEDSDRLGHTLRAAVQSKGLALDKSQGSIQPDSDASTPEAEAQRLTDILFKLNLKTGSTARERRKVHLHGLACSFGFEYILWSPPSSHAPLHLGLLVVASLFFVDLRPGMPILLVMASFVHIAAA